MHRSKTELPQSRLRVATGAISLLNLLASFAAISSAAVPQSLVLNGSDTGTVALNSPAYANITSCRWDLRIHNYSFSSVPANDYGVIFSILAGNQILGLSFYPNGSVTFTSFWDSIQDNSMGISVNNMAGDILVRLRRDMVAQEYTLEVWNTVGGGYQIWRKAIISPGPSFQNHNLLIGDSYSSVSLAFLRWFTAVGAAGDAPPSIFATAADLLELEFDGSTLDSSPNNSLLTFSSSVSYTNTPQYPPSCSILSHGSFRAAYPGTLDASTSYALDGNPFLAYNWLQISGPSTLDWNTTTSAHPVINGLTMGSYVLQLSVTDSSGETTVCTVKQGAVQTDDNYVVIIPNADHARLLGSMTLWGVNPWPFYDDRHKAFSDLLISNLATRYAPYWNTPGPGTITVTNQSQIATGVGTAFQTTFCAGAGNTTPGPNNPQIIVWYPSLEYPGTFGRRTFIILSCDSQTQMHIVAHPTAIPSYYTTPCCVGAGSGLNYTYSDDTLINPWIYNPAPANYYDDVMALYAMYYRSGIDDYLTAARTLADAWWTMPLIDRGSPYDGSSGIWAFDPRSMSMGGLYMRALDDPPEEMWTGLRQIVTYYTSVLPIDSSVPVSDVREDSYMLRTVALCGMFDPDTAPGGQRSQCLEKVNAAMTNKWIPYHETGGNWRNFIGGIVSWGGTPPYSGIASMTLTNGSTAVVGTGATGWTSAIDGTQWMWVGNTSNWQVQGDPVGYKPIYVDATHLILDKPYQGTSGSGKGFNIGPSLVGPGTQPYMMGIAASAMALTAQALATDPRYSANAATAQQYLDGIALWLKNVGYQPASKGLYYARGFVDCEPDPDSNPNCSGSRALSAEAVNAISLSKSYGASYDPTLSAFADLLYNAMYCKPGQACSDGTYLSELEDNGYMFDVTQGALYWKWYGLFFGVGAGWQWPAVRLP